MSTQSAFDLTGQVAVVTGAGRGIGEGIAQVFADAGAAVVIAARRTEEIERVAADIIAAGGQAKAVTTDVTDRGALEALADTAVDTFGSLAIWVNNAGGSPHRLPLTELSREGWDDCLSLNITSIWEATNVAASRMAPTGESVGAILNISSIASHGPMPGSGHYAAAKAATNSLTMTFARELAPRVRVNCICPGAVANRNHDARPRDGRRHREEARSPRTHEAARYPRRPRPRRPLSVLAREFMGHRPDRRHLRRAVILVRLVACAAGLLAT